MNKLQDELICPKCKKSKIIQLNFWHRWHCTACGFDCNSDELKKIYSAKLKPEQIVVPWFVKAGYWKDGAFMHLFDWQLNEYRLDVYEHFMVWSRAGYKPDLSKKKPEDIRNAHAVPKEWLKQCGYKYLNAKQEIKY